MIVPQRMSQVLASKAFTTLPAGADKRAVITALAQGLANARKIAAEHVPLVVEEALRREAVGSTGIGQGIGIPHCRTALVDRMWCAYGRSVDGIDFDSLDAEPVYSVFLLVTPIDAKEQHLQLMRAFAALIRKEHFSDFLRKVEDAQSLIELLAEFENK